MRLIDANDVKRRGDCYLPDIRKTISNILSHTKTVKDAVVIVRCKDCVHYDLAKNGYNGQCNRQYATFYADDFCSYGVKRGDAE